MTTTRTVSKFVRFVCDNATPALCEIPVNSISVVGLVYEEQDLTAWQDAIKGALPNMPDAPIEISGPFSTDAVVAVAASGLAPALTGSHTALITVVGLTTPLSLGIYFGMGRYWTTGDPTFGLISTSTAGYLCTSYTVDPSAGTYSAKFVLYPGSTAPVWATTAIT